MSAETVAVLERIKARFASGVKPVHITDDDVSQYNITVGGTVVKTVVFNLKDYTYSEEPSATADVEITLEEEYVLPAFRGTATLVDLLAAVSGVKIFSEKLDVIVFNFLQGKIQVKGNTDLLVKLDERSKRIAAAAAAAKQQ